MARKSRVRKRIPLLNCYCIGKPFEADKGRHIGSACRCVDYEKKKHILEADNVILIPSEWKEEVK